ncbi:hypothetical protein JJB09_08490 [Rhizobium sp. KVB221]|uniref:Uncharacterized protein n=1 Tax=Rhizobium setariae TaxID=2801340 RepID=A0A936YPX9_9HYPH|nr:hypothetical protein [Rhizobium setariae]
MATAKRKSRICPTPKRAFCATTHSGSRTKHGGKKAIASWHIIEIRKNLIFKSRLGKAISASQQVRKVYRAIAQVIEAGYLAIKKQPDKQRHQTAELNELSPEPQCVFALVQRI